MLRPSLTRTHHLVLRLLDRDGLGQVTWEVDVEALLNGQPVGNQLERDHVEQTLEAVDGLGDLDLFSVL